MYELTPNGVLFIAACHSFRHKLLLCQQPQIVTDEFVTSFLLEMSSDVVPYRSIQPEFEKYSGDHARWNNVIKKLGKPLYDEYEDDVGGAIGDLEAVSEYFFWTMGLRDTITGHIKSSEDIHAQTDIPGWEDAEKQLAVVCDHFVGQLDEESKGRFFECLNLRKELILESRYLYYYHGVTFTQKLLKLTGVQIDPAM